MTRVESETRVAAPPPVSQARRVIAVTGLVLCVAVVLLAALSPTPLDRGYESAIARLLDILHRHGVPAWFGYRKLEFTANVLMFAPIGFLLALALPRKTIWLVLILIPAFSGTVELLQATFLAERFGSLLDVAANTVGGYCGAAAAVLLRMVVNARDETIIARALWEEQHER